MNQIRSNQVSPSPDNVNPPPAPPYWVLVQGNGQPGSIPAGNEPFYPLAPPQPPRPPLLNAIFPGGDNITRPFDEQSEMENPCRCCCDLGTAAVFFVGLNLLYCLFQLLAYLGLQEVYFIYIPLVFLGGAGGGWGGPPIACVIGPIPEFPNGKSSYQQHDDDDYGSSEEILIVTLAQLFIFVLDTITTIIFLLAVINRPAPMAILFSNVFMCYNFCNPVIPLQLDSFFRQRGCTTHTKVIWMLRFSISVTWTMFSALVAKAYGSAMKREAEAGNFGGWGPFPGGGYVGPTAVINADEAVTGGSRN